MITDPFETAAVGLKMPKVSAEIVTVSHEHADHNNIKAVTGTASRKEPFVINAAGEYEVGGIGVIGVQTFHDDKDGAERGKNLVYTYQIDNVIVCHLGDLGHKLSEDQVEDIGQVDILLAPVGGVFTIGGQEVVEVIGQLSPSIVIPMHYKAPGMISSFDGMATLQTFLEKSALGKARNEQTLKITQEELPEELEIVTLEV